MRQSGNTCRTSGSAQQTVVAGRNDFISPQIVTGPVRVVLHAESSASSTDWVARLCDGLRAHGRSTLALTLTGLGERAHLLTAATNLDTRIQDVLGVLESERLDDVVLCGHSYGGMLITGAANRAPGRVSGLVYIDAYVPTDGDSCWSPTTDAFRRMFIEGAGSDSGAVAPPPGLDPRATPHLLASFLQKIRLDGTPGQVGGEISSTSHVGAERPSA
jgi:pimeloyl-ACP methyl ester carboxylesterase